ncbi:hypothetical protein BDV32DRAFT_64079 [Aspergillus pseudonomiae]|uniref:Uncharacterized protein n=1 Tax=Aspergillus pseudonomiae TaxID=1506151 RepID=A0A5N7DND9_9EURO|nr:uncharacterized protein BDV37DRAFT_279342 [Aspergillus pseudonomiae]KAB8258961.1 hypothetical protein BDV32DRAFT_64079 [Aspergillus pseudonomiae]KAE8407970.1 hypothetical protein BDV37DRAFT_279342 [Aspergillus pseudonomiae]
MSYPLSPNLPRGVNLDPPTMITTCADKFADQSCFESYVRNAIQKASNPQILVFTKVSSSWGEQTVDSVNQKRDGYSTRKTYNSWTKVLRVIVMSTEIHDCVQDWWRLCELDLRDTGVLTSFEQIQLVARVGTTLMFQSGPYRGSQKEPDFFLRANNDRLPSFVIESGWSESWDDLMNDMNLLLVGGDGDISAVVILKWSLNRNTMLVEGAVELYVRDRNGMPVRRQREVIFPAPPQTQNPQRLELTRKEIFGPHLLADPARNGPPNAMVYLEISHLRLVATRALQLMTFTPA